MLEKKNIPKELQNLRQWVCWRLEQDKRSGRDCKVPYSPKTSHRASPSNPETWGSLNEAINCAEKYLFSGIGFMFTAKCGIIGIDIDHCLDNGKPNEVAAAILSKLPPTYIEVSPSGTGLHIFLKGKLPSGGNKNTTSGVEMYSTARYFTVTGNRWRDCANVIATDNNALDWIHKTFIKTRKPKKQTAFSFGISTLTDDKLLEMARNSKDSATFAQLWDGQWQGRYPSQSEADFALCCKLAFWSNRDEGQIDRLFRRSGLFREKWDVKHHTGGATYGENTIRQACAKTTETFAATRKKPVAIFEQDGGYYRKKGENTHQLTNFTVRPIEIIKAEEETQITCDFISYDGEVYRQNLLGEDFCNLQRFKKVLNKHTISLSFFGTEGDLEAFKDYIRTFDWKIKKGVKCLGIFPHKGRLVLVTPTGAVAAGGVAVDTIVQIEKGKSIESGILKHPLLSERNFLTLSELILNYNEPAKTAPILAWVAGCFIKPHLRRAGGKFPHLCMIGEGGSGKSTTLENIIVPVFSSSMLMAAWQETAFTLMVDSASSNIIPQFIEEFKPSRLDHQHINWLYNHMRDAYDGHKGVRGKADQTTIVYELRAPLAIAGEEAAAEAAIRERTIELLFSKKNLNDAAVVETFDKLLLKKDLLASCGRSLLDIALQTGTDEVVAWFRDGKERFAGQFPTRVISNLACVYSGLKLVEKYCLSLGHSWDYFLPLPFEACTAQLVYAVKEYLLDGGNHNKSIVEQTFEVMARMNLKCDTDYTFEAAGKHICLRLSRIYDRYTKYRKDYAIIGECLPYPQFQKQLEHSDYFVSKNKSKRFGSESQKAWTVDFEKLARVCDVSGFLSTKQDD